MIYGEGNLIGYPTKVRIAPDVVPGGDAALDIYDHSTGDVIYVMAAVYSDFQSKDDPNPKTNSYTGNFLARAHLIAN